MVSSSLTSDLCTTFPPGSNGKPIFSFGRRTNCLIWAMTTIKPRTTESAATHDVRSIQDQAWSPRESRTVDADARKTSTEVYRIRSVSRGAGLSRPQNRDGRPIKQVGERNAIQSGLWFPSYCAPFQQRASDFEYGAAMDRHQSFDLLARLCQDGRPPPAFACSQ